jgi:hypothetical protein
MTVGRGRPKYGTGPSSADAASRRALYLRRGVVPAPAAARSFLDDHLDELQIDLDAWVREYNEVRPHQGHWCFGKTSMYSWVPCRLQRRR